MKTSCKYTWCSPPPKKKYIVRIEDFSEILNALQNKVENKYDLCEKTFLKYAIYFLPYYLRSLCLPSYFGEHCMLVILIWEALYILRSRPCLPFYFEEHCIFIRSFQCLLFYFGKHCIFWEVAKAYHFILGSTVYIYKKSSSFTILLCMIKVKKKVTILFITQIVHQ